MTTDETWPVLPADPDDVTITWWDATREGRLLVQRCETCGHHQHYPRVLCTGCGGTDLGFGEASGSGTVVSHTTVHRAPHPDLEPPYVVAIVALDEGPRLLTHLVGVDPASDADLCDAAVTVAWRPLEDGRQLPVFTPA